MENQDFNKELTEYLYGEMTENERAAFEKRLEGEPDLREEYDALKGVRDRLAQLSDKEVVEPASVWGKSVISHSNVSKQITLRPFISAAAAILLVMTFAFVTDFSFSADEDGFYLGFGKAPVEKDDQLNADEVRALLRDAIEKNNRQILAVVGASDSVFQNKFAMLEQSVANVQKKNAEKIDSQVLQTFLTELEQQNEDVVKGYLKLSAAQQQEYFKTVLTQFTDYLQEQRLQDLAMIQNNLIELKQTQSYQKKETDQVLTGLISTINYKSKN